MDETIQFHGSADRYTLNGATALATLYSTATTATSNPAVTLRSVGGGGQAAAFTYDLARSIVLTRQGNPGWAGQDRDGVFPIRPNDLFFGAPRATPQPDWVNVNKITIPQADEQQRLLANLVLTMARDRKPLPRFWYLPRGEKAAVVMTGDDHALGGTAGRFDQYKAAQARPVARSRIWECVRATSYIYPNSPLTNSQANAYTADGFEVALHPDLGRPAPTGRRTSLDMIFDTQRDTFAGKYTGIPAPVTERTHCVAWSDWASHAAVDAAHGIRLDTNYYHYPDSWIGARPGFMTGSGLAMRFADLDGTTIDVYQAHTHMTDEGGQSYPFTVNALLDGALGPDGYYGIFTANMHTDDVSSPGSDAIVSSALSRGCRSSPPSRRSTGWTVATAPPSGASPGTARPSASRSGSARERTGSRRCCPSRREAGLERAHEGRQSGAVRGQDREGNRLRGLHGLRRTLHRLLRVLRSAAPTRTARPRSRGESGLSGLPPRPSPS